MKKREFRKACKNVLSQQNRHSFATQYTGWNEASHEELEIYVNWVLKIEIYVKHHYFSFVYVCVLACVCDAAYDHYTNSNRGMIIALTSSCIEHPGKAQII